jgi:glutamate formiminotransferase
MLECVINVSEGDRLATVDVIARNAGDHLLDVHTDRDHNRSVITVVGEDAARAVSTAAVLALDLNAHAGAHPRFGVVDVVPFVPLFGASMAEAEQARDRFARWMADELGVPCFLYGSSRSLPEVRRRAFVDLDPDLGPPQPHPTAGATAVGARPPLVAYNLWLADGDVDQAKDVARQLRSEDVRALGLAVGPYVQVSLNLVAPDRFGPEQAYDAVATRATVERAELVGLVPQSVLDRTPIGRWTELDLAADRTIDARLAARGLLPR